MSSLAQSSLSESLGSETVTMPALVVEPVDDPGGMVPPVLMGNDLGRAMTGVENNEHQGGRSHTLL